MNIYDELEWRIEDLERRLQVLDNENPIPPPPDPPPPTPLTPDEIYLEAEASKGRVGKLRPPEETRTR